MKRNFYIFCVMVLVGLLTTLANIIIELIVLKYFSYDLPINFISSAIILLVAIIGGYYLGRFWWKVIYIEKRYRGWKSK